MNPAQITPLRGSRPGLGRYRVGRSMLALLLALGCLTVPSRLDAQDIGLPSVGFGTSPPHEPPSSSELDRPAAKMAGENVAGENAAGEQAEVTARLAELQSSVDKFRARNPNQRVPEDVFAEVELLKWLDLLYSQRQQTATRKQELEAELALLQRDFESIRKLGVSESTTHTFLELDDLRDKLNTEKSRRESIKLELNAAEDLLASAKRSYEAGETTRRLARETLDAANDKTRSSAARRHSLAQLRSRARGESMRQHKMELEITHIQAQISETKSQYLAHKVETLGQNVRLTQPELDSRLALIDRAEAGLRKELGQVQTQASELNRRLVEARSRREGTTVDDEILNETVATWQLGHRLLLDEASLIKQVLAEVGLVRACWRKRYELTNSKVPAQQVARWHAEVSAARQQVSRFSQLIEIRINERRSEMATLQKRLLVIGDENPAVGQWVNRRIALLHDAVDAYGSQLVLIKSGQRTIDRFEEELGRVGIAGGNDRLLNDTLRILWSTWNYEITSVDDRPITVRKIVLGVGLMLGGFLIARLLSRVMGSYVLPRFGLNSGATLAFQSIAFYIMFICFGFLSLEVISLPLTIFAFMGGAIAIGVGFGSQNVLNNFISGLILLAERPIRVGDLVEIDGLNGTIERIGARSTRVKTGSNLEIIVPNAKFLENNVTNWTLSDTRIRIMVGVGVSYGSPTREVNRLLGEAVENHPDVLKTPAPIILFKEFGDNSLNFEVHFWVHMRTIMQGEAIASTVRHTIDDSFERANITIAFPQRDVHLDVSSPINVNLRSLTEESASPLRRHAA